MARLVDQTPSPDGGIIQAVSCGMLDQPPDTLTDVDGPIQQRLRELIITVRVATFGTFGAVVQLPNPPHSEANVVLVGVGMLANIPTKWTQRVKSAIYFYFVGSDERAGDSSRPHQQY